MNKTLNGTLPRSLGSGVYLLQWVDDNALDRRPINVGVVGHSRDVA